MSLGNLQPHISGYTCGIDYSQHLLFPRSTRSTCATSTARNSSLPSIREIISYLENRLFRVPQSHGGDTCGKGRHVSNIYRFPNDSVHTSSFPAVHDRHARLRLQVHLDLQRPRARPQRLHLPARRTAAAQRAASASL